MQLGDLTVYAQGRFMRYDDARIGLLSHGLNYGIGCFEGVRGFWNAGEEELYLLQPGDHYDRLAQSAGILMMRLPHTTAELTDITVELCVRNGFRSDVYLRPLAYKSTEDVGVRLHDTADAFAIVALPFERYFDGNAGLQCAVSSWRRIDDTMAPVRGKVTGLYVNSALAKSEAMLNGFDEAIMLSADGHVAEGSAENLFMVRRGVLYTPDPSQNILEGVTRRTLMTLARTELGLDGRRAPDRPQRALRRRRAVHHRQRGRRAVGQVGRPAPDRRGRARAGHRRADRPLRAHGARRAAEVRALADAGVRVAQDARRELAALPARARRPPGSVLGLRLALAPGAGAAAGSACAGSACGGAACAGVHMRASGEVSVGSGTAGAARSASAPPT